MAVIFCAAGDGAARNVAQVNPDVESTKGFFYILLGIMLAAYAVMYPVLIPAQVTNVCGITCDCGRPCPCSSPCPSWTPPGPRWQSARKRGSRHPIPFDATLWGGHLPACGTVCECGAPCPCSAPCPCVPGTLSQLSTPTADTTSPIVHGTHNHAHPAAPCAEESAQTDDRERPRGRLARLSSRLRSALPCLPTRRR